MLGLLFVVALSSQALAYEPIGLFYHSRIGIPEAARIKAAEEAADFNGSRIVGGSQAPQSAYPYLAGLLIAMATGQTSVCGSSLLSNTKLVTAAHCWTDGQDDAISLEVILGSHTLFSGGTRIVTSQVEAHASYSPFTMQNDIAIITIPWTDYTNSIQPITLPSGFLLFLTFEGNQAQAAGYGRTADAGSGNITTSQVVSHVTLPVISVLECQSIYGFSVIGSTLCTSGLGGKGTCSGDSGGPLALTLSGETYLIGVTSFGAQSGCQIGFPSGFARVTSFINWINARL